MLSVGEEEEVFFDAVDHLVKEDWMCSHFDYEIWLREPQSVIERREKFLYKMGFVERSSETMEFEQSPESYSGAIDDNLLDERRKSNSEANCSVDYSDQDWLDDISIDVEREINQNPLSTKQCEIRACLGEIPSVDKKTNRVMSWWRSFTQKIMKNQYANVSKDSKLCGESRMMMSRMRVEHNQKRCMECTAVYARQELKAHNGLIWTMKFSPDGRYLASGGADGIVCIWRVTTVDADKCNFNSLDIEGESSPKKKKSIHASVVIPEKIFHIEDQPVHKFHGHSSDVLDLAWSTSNHLLSSSMDKTVRLWQVGSDECLRVFHHSNYVTCVQFNPIDEKYFISGSIDGKVRIWGIPRRRVEDWANVRDIVTAVCYRPNGKGFVVGSVSGTCRFYEFSGDEIMLNAEINMQGRKKSSSNRITGIQFLKNDSQRVMITSEDSKIRILDGLEVVRKYRGLTKSGSQTSASFTPSGRHLISVGKDSRIYLWNHDDLSIQTSKQPKSTRSCEHFFSERVTVALPWSDSDIGHNLSSYDSSPSITWDSERFSLANWFSLDGSSRASTTWPEEKLPVCNWPQNKHKNGPRTLSTTWGLVFVTANNDGKIRAIHNYGLPIRI